jgi:hypothetical protein
MPASVLGEKNRAGSTDPRKASRPSEPSQYEVVGLVLFSFIVFTAVVLMLRNYFALVDHFGDNPGYMAVASAIRRWNFTGLAVKQFWGYPYLMAVISITTGVSDRSALLLVSCMASFLGVALAYRLWGGWVAGLFAVLSFEWMQRAFLGGAEPLFVALLFGSFLAARKGHWLLASLLASCSTVVRPLGVFALFGIGLVLLFRRQFSKLALATLIGLAIGALYVAPFARYFGDPFATVHSYQIPDPAGGSIFGLPFHAIIKGTLLYPAPWTNLVLSFGWIFFVLAGTIAMFASKSFHEYAKANPAEVLFAGLYLSSIYCYNYPYWARGSFERFAIPILPFVLFALLGWLPKNRRLVWGLALISPVLAAVSAVGIKNVAQMLRG